MPNPNLDIFMKHGGIITGLTPTTQTIEFKEPCLIIPLEGYDKAINEIECAAIFKTYTSIYGLRKCSYNE